MGEISTCCSRCGISVGGNALWLRDKDLLKEVPLCRLCYESIKKCKMEEGTICNDYLKTLLSIHS